ncbi:3-oxoacyl-ACP reductase [Leifsonia sp. ku-ls]|nr:3-oxoacyl-ACP reductase [Leifsonia sp. ku-ls]
MVVGASRGLGRAIAETYARRGVRVVGTVRMPGTTLPDGVEPEALDLTDSAAIAALRTRLDGRRFDLLFVVAGVSLAPRWQPAAEIATRDFELTMDTNVLGVMRTIEALHDLVDPTGTVAVMSSGQGSIANNTSGGFEVYRASKAALNQLFRSFAARHADDRRSLLLLAPGWVNTGMGGPEAPLTIDDSIPALLGTIDRQRGVPGLQYLDRNGATVPW